MNNIFAGSKRIYTTKGAKAVKPPNIYFSNREPNEYDRDNVFVGDFWLYTRDKDFQELWYLASLAGNSTSRGKLAKWVPVASGSTGNISSILTDSGLPAVVADTNGQVQFPFGENTNTQNGATVSTLKLNLNRTIHWPSTNAVGDEGVIYLDAVAGVGGSRFMHNYGDGGSGDFNTFLGINAGNFGIIGVGHTGIGWGALQNITIGGRNTAVGTVALHATTEGDDNTAVGFTAGNVLTLGTNNTAVGSGALRSATTANFNSALGANALAELTTGDDNVAVGYLALNNLQTGSNNVAIGSNALQSTTISSNNIAIGFGALDVDGVGASNIAIGTDALGANTGGTNCIAIGENALLNSAGGANSIAIGINALTEETSGSQNTGVGGEVLSAITTGTNNVALGFQAGSGLDAASSLNICIGATGETGDLAVIRIGEEGDQTKAYIQGIYNVTVAGTVVPGNVVNVDQDGQLGTVGFTSLDGSINIAQVSNGVMSFTTAGGGGGSTNPISFSFVQATDTGNLVDGSTYTMGTDVILTEIFNVGSGFFAGGGTGITPATFTAPVDGKYYMQFQCHNTTTSVQPIISIVVTGDVSTARTYKYDASLAGGGAGAFQMYTTVAQMTMNDVATFTITGTSGGTNDWKIKGDGGDNLNSTRVSGFLLTGSNDPIQILGADVGSATGTTVNIVGSTSIATSAAADTVTIKMKNITDHAVQVGNGTDALTSITPIGTAGQVLTSNGPGVDPSWQDNSATFAQPFSAIQISDPASPTVTPAIYELGSGVALTSEIANVNFTLGDGAGTPARFTAPADGVYQFTFGATVLGASNPSGLVISIDIAGTSAKTYTQPMYSAFSFPVAQITVNANMTTGDVATFRVLAYTTELPGRLFTVVGSPLNGIQNYTFVSGFRIS